MLVSFPACLCLALAAAKPLAGITVADKYSATFFAVTDVTLALFLMVMPLIAACV